MHSLENHQLQLMLVEQQNRKRLTLARKEQDSMTLSHHCHFPGSAKLSPVLYSARSSPWLQDYIRNSPESFKQSPSYYSAYSSPSFVLDSSIHNTGMNPIVLPASEYTQAAEERDLILPPDLEVNWSGRENGGQHVQFAKREEVPLEVIGKIGMSLTATVDSVRCRRIMLARKTMTCGRRLKIRDAFAEVEHLQKLRHPHIVQLVGSYLQGNKFAVLLYPVADCDLGVFLEAVSGSVIDSRTMAVGHQSKLAIRSLWNFFGCLSEALTYIHSQATKHLDIKPGNILVKEHPDYLLGHRVYIADFGVSRHFLSLDHSQTEEPVPRTPKYCAPEVWNRKRYGRAADIFSIGCVFMEMLTTLCGREVDDFADYRMKHGDWTGAYRLTLSAVYEWAEELRQIPHKPVLSEGLDEMQLVSEAEGNCPLMFQCDSVWLDATLEMLAEDPKKRKMSWVPLYLDGEICSSCDGVREAYREDK